jgi:diguanylate cyclase
MPRILVIEDELDLRENLLDLLSVEGFEVIGAEDGHVGVQFARQCLPDLILCDISMPGLDGYAVLEQLRQNSETAGIPLIFLTARATHADMRQGMSLGADDYLTKPFSLDELREAIITRLAKYSAITQPYFQALQQADAKLNRYLYYDPTTHLPTRLLLQETFNQTCQQLLESPERKSFVPVVSLLIERFDRFHSLQEADHDQLIGMIAQRLAACLGEHNIITRLGDDRFAMLLAPIEQSQEMHYICQRLLYSLTQQLKLNQQELFLTARIGAALYPTDGKTLNDLIHKASAALHSAVRQGGNQYQLYTSRMAGNSAEQLKLEADLRRALDRNELCVYYQPQVDLSTGKITGAEALVRWLSIERGIVSPTQFIPLAEEIGLIRPIGEWVLCTACQQVQAWRQAGMAPIRIAVNLSGQQLNQPQLATIVAQVLQSSGLDAEALELELTEGTLLQNEAEAIAILNELKALGVGVAIDDFGTGYASLNYLRQFPFDVLKIDRSFIQNVHSESYNNAITTAVLQMAHHLNLKVVAEGVETEAELAFLQQHGCHAIQGFLFSHPVPAAEFQTLLLTDKSLTLHP